MVLVEGPEILLRLALATTGDPSPEPLAALEKLFGQPAVTGATLAELQQDLKCGANCGSCVPELRRLAAIH